jgi:hypothetical protein
MREIRTHILVENLKASEYLEELSVDGRIMLKFIFEKYVMMGTGIR